MSIAIIGAMEEEIELLRSELQDRSSLSAANSLIFYSGQLNGQEVVLLCCGIGKVNAALATAVLLERFQCELIINTGVAGGLDVELQVGDVVIATELAYSDVDATAFNYVYGQVPQMPKRYAILPNLLALAQQVIDLRPREERIVTGLITTADSFISHPERAAYIRTQFPEVKATDMEGAAIAQTAYQFGVPFVNIRSISDIAGSEAAGLFKSHLELAARNSAEVVKEFISLYMQFSKNSKK